MNHTRHLPFGHGTIDRFGRPRPSLWGDRRARRSEQPATPIQIKIEEPAENTHKSKFTVEDCQRFDVHRELAHIRLNGWTTGSWRGLTWKTYVSANGSVIQIGEHSWKLVLRLASTEIGGTRWHVKGRDHRQRVVRELLVTPDGKIGTRWELKCRYKSQRLWSEKRQRGWQRQKILEKLHYHADPEWICDHPTFIPPRPKWMKQVRYQKLTERLRALIPPTKRT